MTSFARETAPYQGPLEKLLDMIEARKLSITEVSLAEVCDSYLAYVEHLPEMPLAETSQFVLVASTLLLIKSRSLLPTLDLSQDERESVEELERRLTRLRIIREATRALRKRWGTAPLYFARRAPARPTTFSPAQTTIERIVSAVNNLMNALPKPEALAKASVAPVIALEDVIRTMHQRLKMAIRTRFSELTKNAADKHEVIVHFLAMLELVRSGTASATQDKLFSDITIELEQISLPQYGSSGI